MDREVRILGANAPNEPVGKMAVADDEPQGQGEDSQLGRLGFE